MYLTRKVSIPWNHREVLHGEIKINVNENWSLTLAQIVTNISFRGHCIMWSLYIPPYKIGHFKKCHNTLLCASSVLIGGTYSSLFR